MSTSRAIEIPTASAAAHLALYQTARAAEVRVGVFAAIVQFAGWAMIPSGLLSAATGFWLLAGQTSSPDPGEAPGLLAGGMGIVLVVAGLTTLAVGGGLALLGPILALKPRPKKKGA